MAHLPIGDWTSTDSHEQDDPAFEARWEAACRSNPRLHDGPILSVERFAAATSGFQLRRTRYKRLVVQRAAGGEGGGGGAVDAVVKLLGAKGLILGTDAQDVEHVLLARRSGHTRIYGGMWEIGPGGGVEVPPPGATHITAAEVLGTLLREGEQELGIDLARCAEPGRWVAVVEDGIAMSYDLVWRFAWRGPVNPRSAPCRGADRDWEYTDVAWVSRADMAAFVRDHARAVSPPTVVVLDWLGWLPPTA